MDTRKIRRQATASVCLTLALVGVFYVVYLMAQHAGNQTYVESVPPITSAVNVARQIDCGRVQDLGPAPAGGVADSAVCFKDGQKYGIDTFESINDRNAWLNTSETLGVVPRWEAATWVAYPSVSTTQITSA